MRGRDKDRRMVATRGARDTAQGNPGGNLAGSKGGGDEVRVTHSRDRGETERAGDWGF